MLAYSLEYPGHPNSEAGNDEIQNFQREVFILWELHSKILVGDKNLL
jgi:hypothetical protein